MKTMITTKETSEKLGVSIRRVQALINSGRLKAKKLGQIWVIEEKDLEAVQDRKPGKPKK